MRVNEIFYSLQGEGFFTGEPAVFLRLSGCNLKCPFCDTEHLSHINMNEEEIVKEVNEYPSKHIVITGGEPLMQLNKKLINLLHDNDWFVQVETNGTIDTDLDIDWITCSPKDNFVGHAEIKLNHIDELKLVFDGVHDVAKYQDMQADYLYLQPCDVGDRKQNQQIINDCVDYIKSNPIWMLSLQTQKILNVR